MATFDHYSREYKNLLDHSVACSGEDSDYFAEYKARYIAALAGPGFAGKILDYGCGIGLLSNFLKKHLPNSIVHGYDVSRESIEIARRDLHPSHRFSSDLSAIDRDYQLVVIANVMHHVPMKSRQQLVMEVTARLDHGGRVVVFEHNPWNPVTRWVVKLCPFDKDAVLLRPGEVGKYMSGAGLSVIRRDFIVFFPRALSFFRSLEPSLSSLPFGAQYALVGERNA